MVYRGEYREIYRRDESTVALAVLRGEGYANPYMIPTGPTAHYPPGHPAILIAIYSVFGSGITAEIAKHIWTCSVVSLQYALLPTAAIALQLPAAAGIVAGLAGAFLPLKYATETSGEWDTPEAAVLLILLIMMSGRRRSVARAFGYGALWGVAFHFAPQFLPLTIAIIALELIRKANPIRHVAVTIAAAALVLLPWTIRNYRTMGGLFFVRDNFGLELALSNRPNAGLTVMDNFPGRRAFRPSRDKPKRMRADPEYGRGSVPTPSTSGGEGVDCCESRRIHQVDRAPYLVVLVQQDRRPA